MRKEYMSFRNLLIAIVLLINFNLGAQIISGSASVELNGPATKEQTQAVRSSARIKIKGEVAFWLAQNVSIKLDTLNALHNHILVDFVDTCLNRTKEETSFLGKTLTLTYSLTDDMIQDAMRAFNSAMEESALKSWNAMTLAQQEKNWNKFYSEAVLALAFSSAHLGSPVTHASGRGKGPCR